MKQNEKWKKIEGVDKYFISNLGRVRSFARYKKGIIKKQFDRNGYLAVRINGRKVEYEYIHRLIAEHFIPNPKNKFCINHRDGKKRNNDLRNLEWCTELENRAHAKKNGLYAHSERAAKSKLKKQEVLDIRELYKTGIFTMKELGNEYGVNTSSIFSIVHRKHWRFC